MDKIEEALDNVRSMIINEICKEDRSILCTTGYVDSVECNKTTYVHINGKDKTAVYFFEGEKVESPIKLLTTNELYDIYKSIEK